jgi:hypothetical protein
MFRTKVNECIINTITPLKDEIIKKKFSKEFKELKTNSNI